MEDVEDDAEGSADDGDDPDDQGESEDNDDDEASEASAAASVVSEELGFGGVIEDIAIEGLTASQCAHSGTQLFRAPELPCPCTGS